MSATKAFRPSRMARRVRELWDELDYAQARLLEIQSGQTGLTRRGRLRSARRFRRLASHRQAVAHPHA